MSYLRTVVMAVAVVALSMTPSVGVTAAFAAETTPAAANHEVGEGGEVSAAEHSATPPILSFDPGAAIVNLAIFLGLLFILSKFVWPVILGGLKAREEKIASDLAGAQAANQEAKSILAEYEHKMSEANTQAQEILADARRTAESNAAKIVDEAKADARRQSERALADIENAKKVALSEIADQTSALAMGVAKQVVGRELRPEDHAELIRKALEQVPSNN
ncbi:F0F1 ATP synthase subunit B [Roseiconus nitratireducens]|uniref:ATP synthase subunit b n=1 Tax=Roseiconus nitratireducens TaxID=2605748 RepID=A0A5M6DCB3_9BACT|nr:F0F1 ATP synthase subunit B [Roseiconus nitratireducens]KAA5545198.1 F0F1 ATP synthase subunit B [Roseiconus nitratireducens]